MAWYRAGGGGIPSSLKSDMNDVLNKKFGTSTTYPAEGWPDNVNLMGPLPEKTVSGAIVTFSDGADAVPLKKCEITLPASLDGYSQVDVVHGGKNFINNLVGSLENGTIDGATGVDSSSTIRVRSKTAVPFPFDAIYSNYTLTIPSGYGIAFRLYDSEMNYVPISNAGFVSSLPSDGRNKNVKYIRYVFRKNDNSDISPEDIALIEYQLEIGSTATTFEPYTAPDTHTASLGRTIYGGTADVVKGQGESTHAKYIVTGQETGEFLAGTNNNGNRIGLNGFELAQKPLYTGGITSINIGENKPCLNSGTWTIGAWCIYTNNRLYFVVPNEYTTFADALQYLVDNNASFTYPLATPETFTFDPVPIDSKLGNNTLWSEQGSTEVTYRADIALALGGQ